MNVAFGLDLLLYFPNGAITQHHHSSIANSDRKLDFLATRVNVLKC
eukprot:COSAG06_NODE_49618_length_324_cov_0.693333_1_plen_45_part_10